ncbi:MAG: helix-turn-helix domain-containing protein [Ruminococcus sp.]
MKIKEARNKVGMSQQQMSEIMDIPKRTIENWESGKTTPPPYVERLVVKELLSIGKKSE